jgi:hypothetical protein
MITVTITADDGVPFIVRFQKKVLESGAQVWADDEVNEIGKSQRYGISEDFRLIVEAAPSERQTDA